MRFISLKNISPIHKMVTYHLEINIWRKHSRNVSISQRNESKYNFKSRKER